MYIQAKVLRALEQHEIVRLGANISTEVDVRFLAATNKNLEAMIQQKMFREDPDRARKEADEIIKNTYRTLMTRGMKGCYVYCTDRKLAEYLKECLADRRER